MSEHSDMTIDRTDVMVTADEIPWNGVSSFPAEPANDVASHSMSDCATHDYRDLVIRELADSEAALIELTASLFMENVKLRELYHRELLGRIHAEARIARLRRAPSNLRPTSPAGSVLLTVG
jgi:hypothetical protein